MSAACAGRSRVAEARAGRLGPAVYEFRQRVRRGQPRPGLFGGVELREGFGRPSAARVVHPPYQVEQGPDAGSRVVQQGLFGAVEQVLRLAELARPDVREGLREQRRRDDPRAAPAVLVGECDRLRAQLLGQRKRGELGGEAVVREAGDLQVRPADPARELGALAQVPRAVRIHVEALDGAQAHQCHDTQVAVGEDLLRRAVDQPLARALGPGAVGRRDPRSCWRCHSPYSLSGHYAACQSRRSSPAQKPVMTPPSTLTIAPVTYDAAGESMKAATRPNSSGCP